MWVREGVRDDLGVRREVSYRDDLNGYKVFTDDDLGKFLVLKTGP